MGRFFLESIFCWIFSPFLLEFLRLGASHVSEIVRITSVAASQLERNSTERGGVSCGARGAEAKARHDDWLAHHASHGVAGLGKVLGSFPRRTHPDLRRCP